MGIYINGKVDRPDKARQFKDWARADGLVSLTREEVARHDAGANSSFVVAVIQNGWMDAAGVAFSNNERDVFLDTGGRPCDYYLATLDWIADVDPRTAESLKSYCR